MSVAPPAVQNENHGQAMAKLAIRREALIQSLKMSGRVIPCTVVNFNPVRLSLADANVPWNVPRDGHFISPDEAAPKTVPFRFDGKDYLPSYIVLSNAVLYTKINDVKTRNGEAAPDYDIGVILPVEQAFQYYHFYNDTRSNDMGGVLIFRGDASVLSRKGHDTTIEVPVRQMLKDNTYEYYFEERPLLAEVSRVLKKQRTYYEMQMQNAQALDDDPTHQYGTVHNVHRVWAQWGLDMKFRETPPKWLIASVDENRKKCPSCKRPAIDETAWFCMCGTPYNAYDAYMSGQEVGMVHLVNLPDEQREKVKEEMARRRKIEAEFESASGTKKNKTI